MISINCKQLFTYCPEDYAVLEIVKDNGRQGIYLVNAHGELIYKCEDAIASEENQSELKAILNSFGVIVVYDINRLMRNSIIAAFLKTYQPMVCDVGADLASTIGTMDISKGKWLVRELKEVLVFYRCEHNIEDPVERAKAILWLAKDVVAESNTVELTIRREQKLEDYRKISRYLLQVERK